MNSTNDSHEKLIFVVVISKVRGFLHSVVFYENIKEEIEQNYELNYWKVKPFGKEFTLPITSAFLSRIRNAARFVSIIITIIMLYLILVDPNSDINLSL